MRLRKGQLRNLEKRVADDPELRRDAERQRLLDEELALWSIVIDAFPTKYRKAVTKIVVHHKLRVSDHHPALNQLYWLVRNHEWMGEPPLHPAVAQVCLEDPQSTAVRRCEDCRLPLPQRRGCWVNLETGQSEGGQLLYFHACPACAGKPESKYDGRADEIFPGQPERPTKRWIFLNSWPGQEQIDRWVREGYPGDGGGLHE